jgi:hypothetical protein
MLAQGTVGQITVQADGTAPNLRLGRLSDQIQSQLHGRYYEGTSRGNLFSAVLAATTGTIAAGNINAAAAAASTQFALWNPQGSGVNLALLKVLIAAISGTPPGGPAFHSYAVGTPNASVGTRGTNNLLGGPPSKGLYLASAAGTALTGSANALTNLRPMNLNFFAAALAAGANVESALELVEGDVVIPPGTLWVPTWAAAGTTFLTAYGISWEEVPQ